VPLRSLDIDRLERTQLDELTKLRFGKARALRELD
jgi:hypothetical protein